MSQECLFNTNRFHRTFNHGHLGAGPCDENTQLQLMWPTPLYLQFPPSAMCGLSSLLVFTLIRQFFFELSCFPSSTITNISIFHLDQDKRPVWKPAKADVASSLNIVIYFMFFFISFPRPHSVNEYCCRYMYGVPEKAKMQSILLVISVLAWFCS